MGIDFSELPWEDLEVEDHDWPGGKSIKWLSGRVTINEYGYDITDRVELYILPDGIEYLAQHPQALNSWLNEDFFLSEEKYRGPTALRGRYVQQLTLDGEVFAQKTYGNNDVESAFKQAGFYRKLDEQLDPSNVRIPKLFFALERRLLMEPLFGFPNIEDLRIKSGSDQDILAFFDKQEKPDKPLVEEDGIYVLKGNPIEKSEFILTDPRVNNAKNSSSILKC